jgi:hypothetical protein
MSAFDPTSLHLLVLCLWQTGNLVVEELLGLLPNPGAFAVLQGKQARKQVLAESFTGFTGKQSWQVVDGDYGEWRLAAAVILVYSNAEKGRHQKSILDLDRNSGLVKGGVDAVDWDGVVRVGGVAANIHHDRQLAIGVFQGLGVNERRNGLAEVDAIDKDIG